MNSDNFLSNAAIDTLIKLYKSGPLEDGDLPSKAGMSELIEQELAYKEHESDKANKLTVVGRSIAKRVIQEQLEKHKELSFV